MNTPQFHSQQCKWFPVCPMKRLYEEGRLEYSWIARYCQGNWESCVRYQLEERGIPHPDTLLPDGSELRDLSGES
ncbi:MAG: uracil-DNA glycosylase [Anaerolineae bacterium]|nr:uracil-DNA glycosylase [Anaerolineae bacterium]